MNVTRHNFKAAFADLESDLRLPTCRFVAIDTEFTGLSPDDNEKERFIDTLEERYKKVKRAGESFLITQFGVSTVHVDGHPQAPASTSTGPQFRIKTWNFYVFPRPYGQSDERFLCQASSLQFLSAHGFDFNKFIGEGISYLKLDRIEGMRRRLEKRIDGLAKTNKSLELSGEGLAFQKATLEQLNAWIESGDARKGERIVIPARNSFLKLVVHETARERANYLYSESVRDGVEVRQVTNKIKEELLAARAKEMRDELEDAMGFSKVIEAISQSKKPVIGHNALLDFVYLFNQFYKPLPETLEEFKQELTTLFPTIYDTKHVALRTPLGAKLPSTSLSSLFEYVRATVKPTPERMLSADPQFDAYRAALKAESEGDDKLLCHEAGFDAFMTGVCFLGLLAHDEHGEVPVDGVIADRKLFDKRLRDMEAYKNCLNLMISDEPFLDLKNLEQKIDRSMVYRVSTNDRKRRLQHVKLEELFEEPNAIKRVLREGDRDAFVFMEEATQVKDPDATKELGVTVKSFDEYYVERNQRKTPTPPSSPKTPSPFATTPKPSSSPSEPSAWSRCSIM